MSTAFYDDLGAGYDAIIDWEARLEREGPFYREVFQRHGVRSVLDTACGTGEHAALFESWGLRVVATDLSEEMLALCRRKYPGRGIRWVRAAFGETFEAVGETFGAVTCLGNSFPHVLTDEDARRAAEDFARLVRPGGVLIIQQLNYEAMRLRDERFMGPQSRMIGECENLFLRVFDLDRDPIRFTMLRMEREPGGWTRHESVTEHRAWTGAEMNDLLGAAGFASVECLGDFRASPLEPATSDQMIVVAGR